MEDKLSKAKRRAIEEHKYYLSQRCGHDVGFEEARKDWEAHYGASWERERHARMLEMQREEINRYKWIESEKAHHDLGREAVLEWIRTNAAAWRRWYEEEYERA